MGRIVAPALVAGLMLAPVAAPFASAQSTVRPRDTAASLITSIGDSYLAGIGAGDYVIGDGCRRSKRSAPAILAGRLGFRHVDLTCPGATIRQASRSAASIPRNSSVVLVQVGGNDLGFTVLAGACLLGGATTCRSSLDQAGARLPAIKRELIGLLRQIRLGAPTASIYVLGYPRLLGRPSQCSDLLGADSVRGINSLQRRLDRALSASARTAGARFVDWPASVDRASLCSTDPWYALPGTRLDDLLHPDRRASATLAARLVKEWDR